MADPTGIPSLPIQPKDTGRADVKRSTVEPASAKPGKFEGPIDAGTLAGVRQAKQDADADLGLDALLERQRRDPLPDL